MADFYDVDALAKIAVNLFYGWGYNFYRTENQLRADDQLIRAKAAWLLGLAHAAIGLAESAYRREFLPPPSRANPYPDAKAVAGAQALERMGQAVSALGATIRSQPVPENDRMTQRYRKEADTLRTLLLCDETLIGQCELLRGAVDGKDGIWLMANATLIADGLKAIGDTLTGRQNILLT